MATIQPNEWFRTCQECGHEQRAKEPDHTRDLTSSYRAAKCHRCHSESLDYGTTKSDLEIEE